MGGCWGFYNLNGGSLTVSGGEYIGGYSTGDFTQKGGTNTVANGLYLGQNAGSYGIYNLSGAGSVLQVTGGEFLGNSGSGTFSQTGGSHTIDDDLYLGFFSTGSTGIYNLGGGSLTVSGGEHLGFVYGTGTFTQTGGSNTAGVIWLGAAGPETYTLGGGSLSASVILGNLSNGGTFIPNVSAIIGNYTQGAAGALQVNIASASSYGQVGVIGTTSLNGLLKPVLLGGYVPLPYNRSRWSRGQPMYPSMKPGFG
jgi:hypothetical protein